jgi:hypothetical protein
MSQQGRATGTVKTKTTKEMLRRIGRRPNVIQIVPPRHVVRPSYVREEDHDLVDRPLASPTGPGGAAGFQNRAGSQIAVPKVTNIYLGGSGGTAIWSRASAKLLLKTATSILSAT